MFPHPSTLTAFARQRHAESLAEADRYRLAQSAKAEGSASRVWGALAAAVVALTLPFVASLLG
jgi:hypothetical protein